MSEIEESKAVMESDKRDWSAALVAVIHRAPYLTILICLLLSIVAGVVGTQLKLRTKIQDLLPDSAPSVIASRSLNDRLGSVDLLVLTLMTDDFVKIQSFLPELSAHLTELPEVRAVRWQQDVELIQRNALITFSSLDDLKQAYEDLVEEIKRAVGEQLILFDEEGGEGSATQELNEDMRLTQSLREAIQDKESWSASWGELESDRQLSQIGAQLRGLSTDYPAFFYNGAYTAVGVKIYPSFSSNDLLFCQRVVERVQDVARGLVEARFGPISSSGVVRRLDLGGTYVSVLDQSKKIKGDMLASTFASFALLTLTLFFAFKSLRGVVCVLIPLVMGTIWTVGLMSVTIGYLNLITAFIFAVLLGLGIDFGIHFFGRYREERALGSSDLIAMQRTVHRCGHASLLAASTTSMAFLALTLADFRGLSQFGGVAALGVMLCLVSVTINLPAIAFIWERWSPLKLRGYQVKPTDEEGNVSATWVSRLGVRTAFFGVFVGVIGLMFAPWVELELNFNQLGAHPQPISLTDEQALSANDVQYGTTKATSPTVAFAQSPEEAKLIYDQLQPLIKEEGSLVKSVQSLYSLVPDQQEERIKWAKKLCRKLKRKYKLFEGDQRAGAEALLQHCDPIPFAERDLPSWVIEQFTDRQGVVGGFLFISPRGSSSDGERALQFHEAMQGIKGLDGSPPMVAGKMMVWAEVLSAMKRDGALTFTVALLFVLCLLGVFERSLRGLLFVSAPLVLGLGFTIGIMAIFGIRLNFFNLLALPTLIGMGVDDGVHMQHRHKELGSGSASYIVRTTGRAAILTTLTTSIGFASLLLADHRGLNSLGSLSVIGMSSALFATLIILPALFNWWDQRGAQKKALAGGTIGFILGLVMLFSMSTFSGCEDDTPAYLSSGEQRTRDMRVQAEPPRDLGEDEVDQNIPTPIEDQSPPPIQQDSSPPVQRCEIACDCEAGDACEAGVCRRTSEPIYCCPRDPCPEGSFCTDFSGRSSLCGRCTNACDCPFGQGCVNGVCQASASSFCCERSPCPTGSTCESPSGSGICPSGCLSACDCWGGESCVNGSCQLTDQPSYCCSRDLCPGGAQCDHENGEAGLCPERACQGACDCPTGFACEAEVCVLSSEQGLTYCCEDAACPSGRSCELISGEMSTCVGEPECIRTCDCPTGTYCEAGRCRIPVGDQELLLCCNEQCITGVACERLDGSRSVCP